MNSSTLRILSRILGVKVILLLIIALTVSTFVSLNRVSPVQADTITVCALSCTYTTIQEAIDNATSGDIITIATGTYTETLSITKSGITLQGAGVGQTILQGDVDCTTSAGSIGGITLSQGISGTTIADLTVTGFDDGIQLLTGPITNTLIEDVAAITNCRHGIYSTMSSGFSGLTLRRVNASSNNVVGPQRNGRGIWVINGVKQNITIEEGVFNSNRLVGIDISDGNVTDLLITSNQVISNGDAGIGVLGPKGTGSTLVVSNTVINNGRFGIEIKNPTGNGNSSGTGSVVVSNNVVSRTVEATDVKLRDYAGIIVFRRYPTGSNADQPSGVVVTGNQVSGYLVTDTFSGASEGFGIVIAGSNHTVANNNVTRNDVGIQLQAGNPTFNITSTLYFDRDNALNTANALISGNTVSYNLYGIRSIGPVTGVITGNLVYSNTRNGLTVLDEASTGILINNNQICHNTIFGVENKSLTSTVNAVNNWWGAFDGPGSVGPGSGDNISLRVAFSPFDTSKPDDLCKGTSSYTYLPIIPRNSN